MAAKRQLRRRRQASNGLGVDAFGGPVIDPTENVLSLVDVEKGHASELRSFQDRHADEMRKVTLEKQDELRDAETRRLDQLAELRQYYEAQASENLRTQVKTTSDLISVQLDKVTNSLGAQITAVANTFSIQMDQFRQTVNVQLAELNRFRYETGGRTSVSDPATAEALTKMASAIEGLSGAREKTEGKSIGRAEIIAYIIAVGAIIAEIVVRTRP